MVELLGQPGLGSVVGPEQKFDLICGLIRAGFSLRKACQKLSVSPHCITDACISSPERQQQYALACQFRRELRFEQLTDIADKATPENAHVARLQVDVIKWQLSKEEPKKYGDRPAEVNVNTTNNFVVITETEQKEIQERTRRLLTEK